MPVGPSALPANLDTYLLLCCWPASRDTRLHLQNNTAMYGLESDIRGLCK